jgi:hypothetical protein
MDEDHKQKKKRSSKDGEGAGRAPQSAAPAVPSGPSGLASVLPVVEATTFTSTPVLTPVGRLPCGEPGTPVPAASTASAGPAKGWGLMGPAGTKPQQGSPEPEALAPALGTVVAAGPGKAEVLGIQDIPIQPGALAGVTSMSPKVLAGSGLPWDWELQRRDLSPDEPSSASSCSPASLPSSPTPQPPSVPGSTGLLEPVALAVSQDATYTRAVSPHGQSTIGILPEWSLGSLRWPSSLPDTNQRSGPSLLLVLWPVVIECLRAFATSKTIEGLSSSNPLSSSHP